MQDGIGWRDGESEGRRRVDDHGEGGVDGNGGKGNRLEYFGDTMPKGISSANREIWVLSVKWMVEKRIERNEEMKKRRETDGDDKSFMRRVGGMKCLTLVSTMGRRFGKCA